MFPGFIITRYSLLATRYSLLATRYSLLATRYSLLATRYSPIVCFLGLMLSLAGCKQTSITNGQTLTGLSSPANASLKVSATLEEGLDAFAVRADNGTPVAVSISDANGARLAYCETGQLCLVQKPKKGIYSINLVSNSAMAGVSLSAAWGGINTATLKPDSAPVNAGGSAGKVTLSSLYASASDRTLAVAIPGASTSDLITTIVGSDGQTVSSCYSVETCEADVTEKGTYFIATRTQAGAPEIKLTAKAISKINMTGVWVVTYLSSSTLAFKKLFISMLDLVEFKGTTRAEIAIQFAMELQMLKDELMANPMTDSCKMWTASGNYCDIVIELKREFFELIEHVIALISTTSDSSEIRAAIANAPNSIVTGPRTTCEAANAKGTYIEFGFWKELNVSTIAAGETAMGAARGDKDCQWKAQEREFEFFPVGCERSMACVLGFLQADGAFDVNVASPNKIEMKATFEPFLGAEYTLERLKPCMDWQPAKDYLNSNWSYRGSQGVCARAVSRSLLANGFNIDGRPTSGAAADYVDFLSGQGFDEISSDSYAPQTSDIVVFPRYGKHPWGHIQIFDGENWRSDYVQPTRTAYDDGPKGAGFYQGKHWVGKERIFRSTNSCG